MKKIQLIFILLILVLIIFVPPAINSETADSNEKSLTDLVNYMNSKNILQGTGKQLNTSLIGAVSGIKYMNCEMYEFDTNSLEYKNIVSSSNVKHNKTIVIKDKFILLCYNTNNKNAIIKAFNGFY